MTYRVEIRDCVTQFHRAHEALIESLGGSHHISRTTQRSGGHMQLMEHNWQKQYNATPVGENSSWKWLDFASEQHYTLFVLRWS